MGRYIDIHPYGSANVTNERRNRTDLRLGVTPCDMTWLTMIARDYQHEHENVLRQHRHDQLLMWFTR